MVRGTEHSSFEGPGMNRKKRERTFELILGEKGLKKIPEGLGQYVGLEVLYLNHNKIRHIQNLSENFVINFLDLTNNKIESLVGSDLACLTNLATLILRNNQVGNIKIQTKELQMLPSLRRLELQNNPMANESDARFYLIAMLPKLEILDSHSITRAERMSAEKMAKEQGWKAPAEVELKSQNDPQSPPKKKKIKMENVFCALYPRRSRSQASHADIDKATRCERDCSDKAQSALKFKEKGARSRRLAMSVLSKHVPLPDSQLERDYFEETDTQQTQSFRLQMNRALSTFDKSIDKLKRPPGDVLQLTRWSELNNTKLLGPAPHIASRRGSKSSLGFSRLNSRAASRASQRLAPVETTSLSFNPCKVEGGLGAVTTRLIRPFTPLFTTFNHRCVLNKINTRDLIENRVLPHDPYQL